MSARAWALFAGVSVLWGVPYLFIKVAVEELSPAFVAWSRCAIAAAVLLPLAARAGALRDLPRAPLIAFATVELIIPWPLIGFGEQHVASSLAAILIATVPLPSGEATLSVLVLGLLCSALAFLLFVRLVAETDASRATVITYVCPLVALAVGIPILGEELSATGAAGLVLILLGSWLATRSPTTAARNPVTQPAACGAD